ncbi:MAG: glycosyltransferase family 4 protein [Acidimicrobiia bacterium]|nr:glycosyltransferase family 4 protein [Acidimicrobiia bacterium]
MSGQRRERPRLVHVTTTDVSLVLLLGPQLRAFADAGYEVIGASAPGPWAEQLAGWDVEHRPLRHATRAMAPHRDAAALAELTRLFRSIRPDVVHTHNPKPGVYGRLAARAARVPAIVNTVHGLYALPDDPWAKRALVYSLERLAATCSHAELVQNPEDLPVLRRLGIPASRLHLLGNGVDLSRFDRGRVDPDRIAALRAELGAGPDAVVCGVVGRLVWEKGYREVFAAAASLAERAPNLRFVVIGPDDPDKADALHPSDLAAAAAGANIVFLGLRHDLVDLYAAMDVYVLASHREGFPRSAMEAAAMGLPVVATDIRGCRQVVDDRVTGRLVPLGDAAALADAVESVAGDPVARAEMSAASLRKAHREFDQQSQIDLTLSVYEQLLQRSGRRARA